jgi:aminoglycoside phosphotransferase (APT) family kinase protein
MNTVVAFLHENQARLGLERYGGLTGMQSLILTPNFRASRHLIFLLFPEGQRTPALVAKVPRAADGGSSLEQEARNLQAVHAATPGGMDSIPRLVAYETYCGYPLLIETAIVGPLMSPAAVRANRDANCDLLLEWLVTLERSTASTADVGWFERLIEQPIGELARLLSLDEGEQQALEQTHQHTQALRSANFPLVCEHGDMSHPNIILLSETQVGVIDWELADPHGLPACDWFFFLSYVASALAQARTPDEHLKAFESAFFGQTAWAGALIRRYTQSMGLADDLLKPLFVACWARYTAYLLLRLSEQQVAADADSAKWLRTNRYYHYWRYTLDHLDQLSWT